MKRKQIRTIHGLIEAGGVAHAGAAAHGENIGLHHNKADDVAQDLANLVMAHGQAEQGRGDMRMRRGTLRTANDAARTFAMEARDVLKPTLGYVHSNAWTMAGFPRSLRVPESPARLTPLLETMRIYFTNNPALEVASRNLTAERAGSLLQELEAAKAGLNAQRSTLRTLRLARREKVRQVQRRLSDLAQELSRLMPADDSRFLEFGLNIPAVEQTPDVPKNLAVVLVGPTAASATWDHAPRAARYRVWKRVVGVDLAWMAVRSVSDRDITILDLPSNAQIEIAVSAVNSGGESAKSVAVTITTP